MLQTFEFVLAQLPLLAAAVLMLLVSKVVFQMAFPGFRDTIIYKNNGALGIIFGGYMLGVAIGLGGIFFGVQGYKTDSLRDTMLTILDFIVLGSVSNAVVLATGFVMHYTLFDKAFPNHDGSFPRHTLMKKIMEEDSKAPAWVIASHFLAGGIIVKGIMTGESDSFWLGLRDIWAYWAVSMVALGVASSAFRHIVTPYDDIAEINRNNEAAGLMTAGFNLAFAVVIKSTLVGASSNLVAEVITTVCLASVLILFMLVASLVVNKLVLAPSDVKAEIVRDKNFGSALLISAILCGIAAMSSNMLEPAMLRASAAAVALAEAEAAEHIEEAISEVVASEPKSMSHVMLHGNEADIVSDKSFDPTSHEASGSTNNPVSQTQADSKKSETTDANRSNKE